MPQLNQRGFVVQFLVLLLLVAGIGVGVYLVQKPTNLFSKAYSPKNPISAPIPTPGSACIQVVTPAKNSTTGECREFPTPCDVPAGWKKVDSCGPTPMPRPSPTPLSCTACNADLNKDGVVNNSDTARMTNCVTGKAKGSACLNMDFNGNGKVDQEDLKCVRSVYNQKCTKPKLTPRSTEMSIF